MAAPYFQRTVVNSQGDVQAGASVEVRNEANNELAAIYTDRALTSAKANPFTTDENGLADFFVARGEYKITATAGGGSIIWRYVQMLDTAFFVDTDSEQTLTNKTLTSPEITTPTGIVKADVGLGNVDNTADSAKNVATAATLATARTIGGVSFDGSANIDLPGVNTAGNQNTTGTSAGITDKTTPTGALVGTTDTQTLTNKTAERLILNDGYTEEVFAITDGTTVNLDPSNGSIQTWTLGDNRTPDQANWAAGQSITLMIDDGTAQTITWTTLAPVWETNGGTAPTLATDSLTVIVLWKVGSTIYGARVGDA
jgi:hypothetical protein